MIVILTNTNLPVLLLLHIVVTYYLTGMNFVRYPLHNARYLLLSTYSIVESIPLGLELLWLSRHDRRLWIISRRYQVAAMTHQLTYSILRTPTLPPVQISPPTLDYLDLLLLTTDYYYILSHLQLPTATWLLPTVSCCYLPFFAATY